MTRDDKRAAFVVTGILVLVGTVLAIMSYVTGERAYILGYLTGTGSCVALYLSMAGLIWLAGKVIK